MSDPKRATLITVGAPKSAKNNVTTSVRLTINLDESNESKYPELNYKELVIAEEKSSKVAKLENGKQKGLDPFSDNDDDVEKVARKLEQKYGGKNTYFGKKNRRRKLDDFADIGAGYDENDSFIDNTDGYDEMIPPECDTFYGGFYINSGSLEFKNVPEAQLPASDDDIGNRRNKRRISSSSSEEESSDSSSESSHDEKDTKGVPNGDVDSHKTEHRKKKNKNIEKKAKRIRRTDSSAATSGKQTSDDNGHGNDESVDSRTSQSDSLTSKPAPSSENAVTSDSSRDAADSKLESSLPSTVRQVVEDMKCHIARLQLKTPQISMKDIDGHMEPFLIRLDKSMTTFEARVQKRAWLRVGRILNTSRPKLIARVKALIAASNSVSVFNKTPPPTTAQPSVITANVTQPSQSTSTSTATLSNKRPHDSLELDDTAILRMSDEEREAKIEDLLLKLKALIEEKKPGMIANYNAECDRVQEERKKLQLQSTEGGPYIEKRLPKRRFPWCARSRALLSALRRVAHNPSAVLAARALPLFPKGFVRMPTLLRQADIKAAGDMKRQRIGSTSQPSSHTVSTTFSEPIQFPSSLTVTTTSKSDKTDPYPDDHKDHKHKTNNISKTLESQLSMINSINKDLLIEKEDRKDKKPEDKYVPPNSIGSITITPVNNILKSDKPNKVNSVTSVYDKQKEPLIRVKTPATLMKEANEIANKDKHKIKVSEKNHLQSNEKRIQSPLLIETNFPNQPNEKAKSSPNLIKKDGLHLAKDPKVDNLRISEDKIPRPGLVPVQHSPTFAKPEKRPPDLKKKKDTGLVIVSDLDPLGDTDINTELVAVDDSSSDVEVIEEKTENCEVKKQSEVKPNEVNRVCDTVPSSDKSVTVNHKKDEVKGVRGEKMDVDETETDIDTVMRNLREMQDSQEPSLKSNTYGGVITNAKRMKSRDSNDIRSEKDKLAERASLDTMDGCSSSSQVDVA